MSNETDVSRDSTKSKLLLPDFKSNSGEFYDFENNINDYSDMHELTEAVNIARYSLFKITNEMNEADRRYQSAKTRWNRNMRRALFKAPGKTSSERKTQAEIMCEKFETPMIEAEQYRDELNRMSNAIRLELQTLQSIGNNLRQQLRH